MGSMGLMETHVGNVVRVHKKFGFRVNIGEDAKVVPNEHFEAGRRANQGLRKVRRLRSHM
jgi:hypothetical protein